MGSINFHGDYENGFTRPYYLSAGKISATTSIQTPNQLYELQQRLNAGVKNVEISGPLDPQIFEQIPLGHFEELRRLAKLSGANISLHAPMFDLAGFSEQGWAEENRKTTEYQFKSIIDKAHKLDPDGNIPITVHTNRGITANIPEKGLGVYTEKEAERIGSLDIVGKEIPRAIVAIDQESGRIVPLQYEEKEFLGGTRKWTPHERMESQNFTMWENEVAQVFSMQKVRNERIREVNDIIFNNMKLFYAKEKGIELQQDEMRTLAGLNQNINIAKEHIRHLSKEVGNALNELNHKATKYGKNMGEDSQELLQDLQKRWEDQTKIEEKYSTLLNKARILGDKREEERLIKNLNSEFQRIGGRVDDMATLSVLSRMDTPKVLIPVEEFIGDKAKKTVVNTAMYGYEQYGDKAPTIAVENWQPETALSRGETFQQFITETKDNFVKELVENKKLSENEARHVANKLIGATWDVAHINMLRKYGYSEEDIIREAQKIKGSDVKKVHLADNFGYSDAHLVTGMGNVPTFRQIEELRKTGLGNEIPMVGEFGAFDVSFKESSFPYVLENVDSPLYTMKMQPRWSAIRDSYPDYFGGYGPIFPDMHFREFYGGGFSNLPRELGGQMPGDRSRFSGTPNQ